VSSWAISGILGVKEIPDDRPVDFLSANEVAAGTLSWAISGSLGCEEIDDRRGVEPALPAVGLL
jgi:hypothetical protein